MQFIKNRFANQTYRIAFFIVISCIAAWFGFKSSLASAQLVQPENLKCPVSDDFIPLECGINKDDASANQDWMSSNSNRISIGQHKRHTLLCQFSEQPELNLQADDFKNIYGQKVGQLGHYFKEASSGRFLISSDDVGASGWYKLPHDLQYYTSIENDFFRLSTLADDCLEASNVEFQQYDGLDFVYNPSPFISGGFASSYSKSVDGTTISIPIASYSGNTLQYTNMLGLYGHEIGHNLGLRHSLTKAGIPYSNLFDVMGASDGHPLAYSKYVLGWISEERMLRVKPGEEKYIHLESHAIPKSGNNPLLVLVQTENDGLDSYSIEARHPDGYDQHIPNHAVIIQNIKHYTQPFAYYNLFNEEPLTRPRFGWHPGDKFVSDDGKVEVCVLSRTNTGYKVQIASNRSIDCEAETRFEVSHFRINRYMFEGQYFYWVSIYLENYGGIEENVQFIGQSPNIFPINQGSSVQIPRHFSSTYDDSEEQIRYEALKVSEHEIRSEIESLSAGSYIRFGFSVVDPQPTNDGPSVHHFPIEIKIGDETIIDTKAVIILNPKQLFLPLITK